MVSQKLRAEFGFEGVPVRISVAAPDRQRQAQNRRLGDMRKEVAAKRRKGRRELEAAIEEEAEGGGGGDFRKYDSDGEEIFEDADGTGDPNAEKWRKAQARELPMFNLKPGSFKIPRAMLPKKAQRVLGAKAPNAKKAKGTKGRLAVLRKTKKQVVKRSRKTRDKWNKRWE